MRSRANQRDSVIYYSSSSVGRVNGSGTRLRIPRFDLQDGARELSIISHLLEDDRLGKAFPGLREAFLLLHNLRGPRSSSPPPAHGPHPSNIIVEHKNFERFERRAYEGGGPTSTVSSPCAHGCKFCIFLVK